MIEAPPDYVIEAARLAAVESPCAKSKRGVVLFNPERADELITHGQVPNPDAIRYVVTARGFNGPPRGFDCKDSWACRGSCRDVCLHAEQRALYSAMACDDVVDLELVHVKVIDGKVVAGGGPSCLQCSRLVVDVDIRGVWLLEAQHWHFEFRCDACSQITVVEQGGGTTGVCNRCDHVGRLLGHGKQIYDVNSGVWRFYAARAFHETTLANNGIRSLGAVGSLPIGGS